MKARSWTAEWQSKHPHSTRWLSIRFNVSDPPVQLFDLLERQCGLHREAPVVPPFGDEQEVDYGCDGSGLFNGWTETEARTIVDTTNALIRSEFGFTPKWRRLTLHDLL